MEKIFLLIVLINIANTLLATPVCSQSNNRQPFSVLKSESQLLPDSIKDPLLLKAWEYLYNQDQPFKMWDGATLTGKKIAQTVLDRHIVITWDLQHQCASSACSPRITWSITLSKLLNIPIYVSPSLKDPSESNIEYLAGVISHELYHHSLPFGSVADTMFEEYWAYFIQSNIAIKEWANESHRDSLNPICLRQWFVDHRFSYYLKDDKYPQAVVGMVKTSAEYCPTAPANE